MSTTTVVWSRSLMAAAVVLISAAGVARGGEQASVPTSESAASGAHLYRTYCASCHGVSAQGNGPLADSLRRRPPNLTEITVRHKGAFPRDLIASVIDGRRPVRGHGGPDMPVWGDAFLRSIEVGSEEAVAARIAALVAYLETLQARNAQ